MGTIGTNISLLARWRPYRLPLSSAVFNGTERFGDVRELTVLFCAQFFPPIRARGRRRARERNFACGLRRETSTRLRRAQSSRSVERFSAFLRIFSGPLFCKRGQFLFSPVFAVLFRSHSIMSPKLAVEVCQIAKAAIIRHLGDGFITLL
jgi:hypothetical protein